MKFRGVTLAALLLSASQTAFADDQTNYDGDGYVTPVAFVGDVSQDAEDAYFAADAAEAKRATTRRQRRVVTAAASQPMQQYVPQQQIYYRPATPVCPSRLPWRMHWLWLVVHPTAMHQAAAFPAQHR